MFYSLAKHCNIIIADVFAIRSVSVARGEYKHCAI